MSQLSDASECMQKAEMEFALANFGNSYNFYSGVRKMCLDELNDKKNAFCKDKLERLIIVCSERMKKCSKFIDSVNSSAHGNNQMVYRFNGGPGSNQMSSNRCENQDEQMEKIRSMLEGLIITKKSEIKLKDIAGVKDAKRVLNRAVILPGKFPDLYNGGVNPISSILFYGVPGVGKTHLLRAIVNETGQTVFIVSSSDINSKWTGEGPKIIRELFKIAEEKAPSIIFFDEIDAVGKKRQDGDSDYCTQMKTTLMIELNEIERKGITFIGATNRPWILDPAFYSRFEENVFFALPDFEARRSILLSEIGATWHFLSDKHLDRLARRTNGFSGREIKNLVTHAKNFMLEKTSKARFFMEVTGDKQFTKRPPVSAIGKFVPCNREESTFEGTIYDIAGGKRLPAPLVEDAFDRVFGLVFKSTNPDDVKKLKKFKKRVKKNAAISTRGKAKSVGHKKK